jgi:hypothetical protein
MEEAKTSFPYVGWILTPSYRPKQLEFVARQHSDDWHKTAQGKGYHVDNIHRSLQAAIDYGRANLARQETKLVKMQQTIDKRLASLDKAERGA